MSNPPEVRDPTAGPQNNNSANPQPGGNPPQLINQNSQASDDLAREVSDNDIPSVGNTARQNDQNQPGIVQESNANAPNNLPVLAANNDPPASNALLSPSAAPQAAGDLAAGAQKKKEQEEKARKEAEAKKAKEEKDKKAQQDVDDLVPRLTRPPIFSQGDRYEIEKTFMEPLVAGSGPCGTSAVDLTELKRLVLNIDQDQYIPTNIDMLENLRLDGIYVDDPEVHQKFTDINVQKLEERLLKNGQSAFFRQNGELKLDNDLLADEMSKPADLAFEQTMAFQTKEVNAVLSDRLNQYKKRYYRLDIIIGKVFFENIKKYLTPEDKLCLKLKDQFKKYEIRTSLSMIPFYQERLAFITTQIENKLNLDEGMGYTEEEMTFLKKARDDVKLALESEKKKVNEMANELYSTWKQIEEERKTQDYTSTNQNLKIFKTDLGDGEYEHQFNLVTDKPSMRKNNDAALPGDELSRRRNIANLRVQGVLFINGIRVSVTNKVAVNWPNFEAEFSEMFQVHVFTMPSSIRLQINLIDGFSETEVDMVEVEVPGQHVNTLTCASQLIQLQNFSKFEYEKRKLKNKYEAKSQIEGKITEAQQKKLQAEKEKKLAEEQEKIKADISGGIYVKAEWKGNGPQMPPIKSENLFKKAKVHKNRKEYTASEQYMMLCKQLYIDVNDPRNQMVIKLLRETRNEYLIKLLLEDSKNLLSGCQPFRHKLLEARSRDGSIRQVPMLESELVDSSRGMIYINKLEEIFKKEAYQQYLQSKTKDQEDEKNDIEEMKSRDSLMDADSMRRRQLIMDKIKERQIKESNEGHKQNAQYKSVVNEVEFEYDKNIFLSIFSKMFQTGRRLRPIIREQPTMSFDKVGGATISVHVIKGENVPIRNHIVEEYEQLAINERGQGRGQRGMQSGSYRPTAFRPNDGYDDGDIEEREDNEQTLGIKSKRQISEQPQVETYVEVRVQYHDKYSIVKSTDTDEGSMPQWNQVLDFPLEARNGHAFTMEELSSSDTMIIASIFDVQKFETSREEQKRVELQEHRFLGSVSIPLQTLLTNPGRNDFNYQVKRPMCLPSYRVISQEVYLMNSEDFKKVNSRQQEPSTYLNLSISIEPNIQLPFENSEVYYPGFEASTLLDKGHAWVNQCRKHPRFKNVNLNLFGSNIDGKSVLIQRYLTPMEPPKQVVDLSTDAGQRSAIESAARFVSLIPFVEDLKMFQGMPDIYSTVQEFLDLGGGDYEEHAILLCNYFNWIDKEICQRNPNMLAEDRCFSYLVYGKAMPEGNSVYVLRKKNFIPGKTQDHNLRSVEIWSPLTGTCYHYKSEKNEGTFCGINCASTDTYYYKTGPDEPLCPLRNIHMIAGSDNVWANIQKHDFPLLMEFDLNNKKHWKPFHMSEEEGVRYSVTVQPKMVLYSEPKKSTQMIESKIQKFLVEKFQDQRIKKVSKTTKWDVSMNDEIVKILQECEIYKRTKRNGGKAWEQGSGPRPAGDVSIAKLTSDLDIVTSQNQTKRVWGHPINCTLVTFEGLWQAIKTTKMYMVPRQDIEFCLTVSVEAYPSNVFSVWIYLAAMVDRSLENF